MTTILALEILTSLGPMITIERTHLMVNLKKISLFLLITFLVAWSVPAMILVLGNRMPVESLGLAIALMMFSPAIGVLIVKRYLYREPLAYSFSLRNYEYLIIAWLIPVIFSLISAGLTVAMGLAKFDPTMKEFLSMFPEQILERGLPPFYIIFLFSLVLPVLINIVFAVGEEIGWRGFLRDELLPLGQSRTFFITGLIWGIWHAPVVMLGFNYPGHPVIGPIWMVVFCILISYIFGWLREKADSLWAPVIAHASLNGPAMSSFLVLAGLERLWGGVFGVVGFAVMGSFVLWLVMSGRIK